MSKRPHSPGFHLVPLLLLAGLSSARGEDLQRHYDARAALGRAVVPELRSQATAPSLMPEKGDHSVSSPPKPKCRSAN